MVEFGYPDVEDFDEVVSGFKLTGNTPLTSIFPPTFNHPGEAVTTSMSGRRSFATRFLVAADPKVRRTLLSIPRPLRRGIKVGPVAP